MKKFLIIFLFALSTRSALAQKIWDREFKPFKIDVSAGYAIPQASGAKGGLLFALEPKYAFIGDPLSFGLRLEAAILTPVEDTNDISTQQSQANVSALLTGDYYFNNNNLRPFLGGGFGLYSVVNQTGKDEGALLPNADFSNRFGFMLRGGVEWGHLRMGLEYNFVSSNSSEAKYSYIGIKAGIVLGGGRMGLISDN
jgi:hypothetical protein